MKTILKNLLVATILLFASNATYAWEGMEMPPLRVEGRNLVDPNGNIVKLHGYAQTFSPWFNERGRHWNNYDVTGCLKYNQGIIDNIMAAGWKMNFVRMHMDPYWSNIPGRRVKGENDISAFDFNRFTKYLDEVFVPMAEYAIKKGMYVVMRPPGVCPEKIAVGDDYQKYLLKVWRHVARHEKLKNHPNIMFELANEPINIVGSDGTVGGGSKAQFEQLSKYFQEVVDTMRTQGCNNILWVPGLGYQSKYAGYANYPIKGENIGYAVHIYPGWFGSSHNYEAFARGWKEDVQPVSDFAPIMITEMDWADKKYNASWGKAHTGVAGDHNFGANFKKITDDAENVSWLLFTSPEHLAAFKDEPAKDGNYTFLTDPEACPWPVYHWYQEYAKSNYPRKMFTCTSNGVSTNDNFRHYDLASQWTWNSNSDSNKWSLTERAGFLRLRTASVTNNLLQAYNILTQPILKFDDNLTYGTIAIDVTQMKDGDVAGLAVMHEQLIYIAVKQSGRKKHIIFSKGEEESKGERIKADLLYLRAVCDHGYGKVQFLYSTDNYNYKPCGKSIPVTTLIGNKFAIFNYATKSLGGWVDIDWFSTEPQFDEATFYDDNFTKYSEESLSVDKIEFSCGKSVTLLTGNSRSMELVAHFKDGHTEDISSQATYCGHNSNILSTEKGRLTALKDGSTTLTATFKGARGEEKSCTLAVTSSTFPLTKETFNPSIWDKGTFDENSHTATTGRYGFAGWRYDKGLDLTKHKFLIVEISGGDNCGLSFRLFDTNNYWSDCAAFDFNGKKRLVIPTGNIIRNKDKTKKFAAEHVYILGFWSTGGVPFTIEKIYFSNKE
ncbi:MAG: cellulase family glycosylhydrolase [Bacteroidaceae bacterium]|nr:cellulase family glycosylhydrolase [Bacteroidaceae bacterium]